MSMKKVVAFGEIMARLAAPGNLRLRQSRNLDVTFAGAEASVAASICNFGGEARYVTALPKHALAEATMDAIRAVGIDTKYILRTDKGRLGLYFLETGANHRPSNVIYDRADSAIARTKPDAYDWDGIFDNAQWLHLTGITPAISKNGAEATLLAAKKAKELGISVSLDLNLRPTLWKWDENYTTFELAQKVMADILPFVDVLIGNEENCYTVLGIKTTDKKAYSQDMDASRYPNVVRKVVDQFPNISKVAITIRESISANHNRWGAMLFDVSKNEAYYAPLNISGNYCAYEIKNMIDRVGGGDSFAGALIFALITPELSEGQTAVNYAVAASCLKHSIKGDFNYSTRGEVEQLMKGNASGRIIR